MAGNKDCDQRWHAPHGFQPLSDAEWPQDIADLKRGFAGKLNVYRVMAKNPALMRAWETYRNHLVDQSALDAVDRETIILRLAHKCGANYEWIRHVKRGKDAGLTEDAIESARQLPAQWLCHARQTYLMTAVDELLEKKAFSVSGLENIQKFLSPAAVLDLVATVGMYVTLAFILNSFKVPLDSETA